MQIHGVSNVSFTGYKNVLKTLWKKGKLPSVERGLYGDKLNIKNVSLEHIIPHSLGGKSTLDNFALASRDTNSLRGNRPLKEVLSWEQILNYLDQFKGVKVFGFSGEDYIGKVMKTFVKAMKE